MLISAITGSQNFPTGSTKLHIFFVPTRLHMGQEIHIGQLARRMNPDVPASASGTVRFSAYSGGPTTLGEWTQANYEIPEGVVLKVFGMKKATMQGQSLGSYTANVFIQLRSGAALNRLSFNLLTHDRSPISAANIEGRFDILSPAEMAQLGIGMSPQLFQTLEQAKFERLFRVSVLDRPTVSRPNVKATTMKNADGQSVTVQKASSKRAVRL
jgi:hypothetical protein